MIDRDPITEPAGDLIAAQTLIEVLTWVDDGGDTTFFRLSETLLDWKGRRLRDAIADTGVGHLGRRLELLVPTADDARLERLCRAAGLVLDGPALHQFVSDYVELSPDDLAFRRRRLEAMGGLCALLTRRTERDLGLAGVTLLRARDAAASELSAGRDAIVQHDSALVEHLYRAFARSDDDTSRFLRGWLLRHANLPTTHRHKVLRTAIVSHHLDVVRAWFEAGTPAETGTLQKMVPGEPGGPSVPLGAFLVARLHDADADCLGEVVDMCLQHLVAGTGTSDVLLDWCYHTVAEGVDRGKFAAPMQALQTVLKSMNSAPRAAETLALLRESQQ